MMKTAITVVDRERVKFGPKNQAVGAPSTIICNFTVKTLNITGNFTVKFGFPPNSQSKSVF